jgi:hypothetical protein
LAQRIDRQQNAHHGGTLCNRRGWGKKAVIFHQQRNEEIDHHSITYKSRVDHEIDRQQRADIRSRSRGGWHKEKLRDAGWLVGVYEGPRGKNIEETTQNAVWLRTVERCPCVSFSVLV